MIRTTNIAKLMFQATRCLAVAAMLLFANAVQANDGVEADKLVLELSTPDENGIQSYEFILAENPEITFSGDSIHIAVPDKFMMCLLADVDNIHFEINGVTAVDRAEINQKVVSVKFVDGVTFAVDGIDESVNVMVYSLKGVIMPLNADRQDNGVVVHLDAYAQGAYIIKIGNQSYKVVRR